MKNVAQMATIVITALAISIGALSLPMSKTTSIKSNLSVFSTRNFDEITEAASVEIPCTKRLQVNARSPWGDELTPDKAECSTFSVGNRDCALQITYFQRGSSLQAAEKQIVLRVLYPSQLHWTGHSGGFCNAHVSTTVSPKLMVMWTVQTILKPTGMCVYFEFADVKHPAALLAL